MLINLIPWEYAKTLLDLIPEEKAQIELLIFSCSAEIEQYTHRVLKRRDIRELRDGYHQSELTLKQYPVHGVTSLKVDKDKTYPPDALIPREYYHCPMAEEEDQRGETPSEIILLNGYQFPPGKNNIEIIYSAGYTEETMPETLKTAKAELLEWTIKRLKNHQIGEINLRHGQQTQIDTTIPAHVQALLKPFKRRAW